MAKVNDYKQTEVFIECEEGVLKKQKDLIEGTDAFWRSTKHKHLIAKFELKRRQSIETWVSQIRKAVFSRLNTINEARRNIKQSAFTEDTLEESLNLTYEQEGNEVTVTIW